MISKLIFLQSLQYFNIVILSDINEVRMIFVVVKDCADISRALFSGQIFCIMQKFMQKLFYAEIQILKNAIMQIQSLFKVKMQKYIVCCWG